MFEKWDPRPGALGQNQEPGPYRWESRPETRDPSEGWDPRPGNLLIRENWSGTEDSGFLSEANKGTTKWIFSRKATDPRAGISKRFFIWCQRPNIWVQTFKRNMPKFALKLQIRNWRTQKVEFYYWFKSDQNH